MLKQSTASKSLLLCLLLLMPALASLPALAKNYIFRTSNTPVRSNTLGVSTVSANVLVGNRQYPGVYIVDSPTTPLGQEMMLMPGWVLLTLDGYSIRSAQQADGWLGHRSAKPLVYTYAAIIKGLPKICSREIQVASSSASASSAGSGSSSASAKQISTGELESACFAMINESRRRGGLNPVSQDGSLGSLARKYADYMADHREGFEPTVSRSPHIDLQGRNPQDRAREAGFSAPVMENIGRASRGMFEPDMRQLSALHKSMMDEGPGGGHYEAIMSPSASRLGVGIARSADRFYLVEEFSN